MADVESDLRAELATARAELEQARRESARHHAELLHPHRMEAAGTLAAGLAHDMNNVLAVIMNVAEILLDDKQEPRVRTDLEQIVTQAERGAALTRSLLAFSRKGQYRKRVVELDDIVRGVLPLFAHALPKSIDVQIDLGCQDARVVGDPVQLGQVLVNLALNAADAMANRGALRIRSRVVELDGARHARLQISDSGCGMDEATRQRVFEPFFTTKPVGKGTGLGLALVWGVVSAHGGTVGVESALGRGTTFCVDLPLTDAPKPATTDRRVRTQGDPMTILVVDDEPAIRRSTSRMLERVGHAVLGASDGAEALRVFAAHAGKIGMVVLDMKMPVMDGAECFRQLRAQTSVPVLIATGYAIDEDVQHVVAHGAALIEKPFSAAHLVTEVTRLLVQRGP